MGNSNISVQNALDWAKAKGIPVPTDQPAGYGTDLALKLANDTMGDFVAERFNWKFNRAIAAAFYTNSYQQDYPQIGLTAVGWLEDADRVDINNTSFPKPIRQLTCRRQLSRTSFSSKPIDQICWMYNYELSFGIWPGAGITFFPLVTPTVQQNPIMSMIDANGNLLIVTTPGKTGNTAPVLALNSAEGTQVTDGTVVWTVVAKMSQGFRVYPLPGATGPVWQVTPYYQALLQKLPTLGTLLNPIPDDYQRLFQVGFENYLKKSSPNPSDRAEGMKEYPIWLKSLMDAAKQGDREADAYGMLPETSPVESVWDQLRNPQDPSQPY